MSVRSQATRITTMKQCKLSARKRLIKPLLFGTVLAALATAFINRHGFLEDVEDLKAQERARYNEQRQEIQERRHKLLEEVAEKKKQKQQQHD